MIPVRIMLQDGENEFREYIQSLRQNPNTSCPYLNSKPYSEEFSPQILIDERKVFNSKMDLAEYLTGCFSVAGITHENVLGESGLWTWLAYIWFDQFAPIKDYDTGERYLKEEAKYICSRDYRDYYRHFVLCPYSIYSLYGADNSRIFLYSAVNEHNDFIEQFASRQFIISHSNIVEAISRLYFDDTRRMPKSGAQSRQRNGNIRRFIKVIQQFELTYDVYSMTPEQILNLLPDEFNGWKQ